MDIFDDDNEVEIVSRPSTASSSSSSRPLFLPDDEEDLLNDQQGGNAEQDDIDKVFESGLADEFDYQPIARKHTIDFDRLEREAQKKAKTKAVPLHEILSSSPPPPDVPNDASNNQRKGKGKDDGGQKEKRKPMRLDEARLVGPTGFPQLIEDTKHFRIKGKGSEATDLNRLLQIYQYWTHRMYPKSQFKDTVERVEKLCHSKLMHNKLSMWRDEAHNIDREEEKSGDEDATGTVDANPDENIPSRASSSAPVSDAAAYASSSPSPPTRPPSSAAPSNAGDEFDQEMELWDQMEMEMANSGRAAPATNPTAQGNASSSNYMDIDDDDEAWAALNAVENQTSTSASTGLSPATASTSSKSANNSVSVALDDDDEEMWEISRQMEAELDTRKEVAAKDVHPSGADAPPGDTTEKSARRISSTEEGFDDMYC